MPYHPCTVCLGEGLPPESFSNRYEMDEIIDLFTSVDDVLYLSNLWEKHRIWNRRRTGAGRQRLHSVLGEANNLRHLGEHQMDWYELDMAEISLIRAIKLHQQARDVLGEANAFGQIGELYMRRDERDKAEASFIRAVELHRQTHSVLSGANNLGQIEELQVHLGEQDKAEISFIRATELQLVHGASALRQLGELQIDRGELGEDEMSLIRAIELHQQGYEANALEQLGNLQMDRDELYKAEISLTRAIKLHQQAQDALVEASCLRRLRTFRMNRCEQAKAHISLLRGLELRQQAHEASTLGQRAMPQLSQSELDKIIRVFERHQQARDVPEEASDLGQPGDLHQQVQDGILGRVVDLRYNRAEDTTEPPFTRTDDFHQRHGPSPTSGGSPSSGQDSPASKSNNMDLIVQECHFDGDIQGSVSSGNTITACTNCIHHHRTSTPLAISLVPAIASGYSALVVTRSHREYRQRVEYTVGFVALLVLAMRYVNKRF